MACGWSEGKGHQQKRALACLCLYWPSLFRPQRLLEHLDLIFASMNPAVWVMCPRSAPISPTKWTLACPYTLRLSPILQALPFSLPSSPFPLPMILLTSLIKSLRHSSDSSLSRRRRNQPQSRGCSSFSCALPGGLLGVHLPGYLNSINPFAISLSFVTRHRLTVSLKS